MSVEQALASLLSGAAAERCYFGRAENVSTRDGAYLVVNRVSRTPDYTLGGPSGHAESRFQIDAYADRYGDALAAASAALAVLDGFSGTIDGTRIMGIFVAGERDLSAADAGEVSHLFRRSFDLRIHHREA